MDNEEDKEEEQTEILAEDDIEGEHSEEPSPAPTIHRALTSRQNTSSPTQHPPNPQTPPQLPLSPLSTPVAPSPIPTFATTPSRAPTVMSYLPRTDSAFSDLSLVATTPPPVPPYLNDALLDAIRPDSRTSIPFSSSFHFFPEPFPLPLSCTTLRHQQSHDITPPSYPIARLLI
ncbi:hypothetical protein BLNAU_5541 [Blattamonas nauphoetae]|uniref:Uncharacterized protein n=1 Tax=Blattamonas nauphoetae TaxID=2049346 RepID=A0ABQ9Y6V1_9EUKA|nr:hypothetical protein BLNAU_5541 [Blattamonas nauphoetae]